MADFSLPKTGYLSFDAISMKKFIVARLNESGVFTDQNYEGSNISNIIDIISYTFNTLIYYLNRTATESMFSEAQIYENMNRIVKMLDYKPIGKQTSTLSFLSSAQNLTNTLYTIPRYSYISLGNVKYSFNEDITFSVTSSALQALPTLYDQKLLYQGYFEEYPIYSATGQDNEIIYLTPGENVLIDHFNIDVYVMDETGIWEQWERANSLYLENAFAKKYEIRYNENKNYEIKFGNDINGKKLNTGSQVAIYYLKTLGTDGEIGIGDLLGKRLTRYSTVQFDTLIQNVNIEQKEYMTTTEMGNILFNNEYISTYYQPEEDVASIRLNAPGILRSQYRLVTESDYENFIKTNFAYFVHDVKTVNNWRYMSEQLKYYYDLGITNPNNESNILYNQLMFADSCNFNNVYLVVSPKTITSTAQPVSYLTASQKQVILSSMKDLKTLTSEAIILDPVYVAVAPCISDTGETPTINDVDQSEIYVLKDANSRRDNTSIQNDVANLFIEYFSRNNMKLGETIDLNQLVAQILGISGIKTFYIRRKDDNSIKYNGMSLLVWNPIYFGDVQYIARNTELPYFKQAYLYDPSNFASKIVVEAETKIYENIEY